MLRYCVFVVIGRQRNILFLSKRFSKITYVNKVKNISEKLSIYLKINVTARY